MKVGPYELGEELGRGGMGVVYRARHALEGRVVALKVLYSPAGLDPEDRARFAREVELAGRVDHPRVARALDSGSSEQVCYMAMPLFLGGSLEDRLKRSGPLPIDEALTIGIDLAGALGRAHELGVIHRDLKPSNVIFDAEGKAYLTDFGLARQSGGDRLTRTGAFLGTPAYMAPEQAMDSKRADRRSDVYGMAGIVYAMLTGQAPVKAEGSLVMQAVEAIEGPPAPPPRSLRPEVPVALDALIVAALSKDPDDRPRDGEALRVALERTLNPEESRSPRNTAAWVVVALALCAALGAGVWLAGSDPSPSPASSALAASPTAAPSATPSPPTPTGSGQATLVHHAWRLHTWQGQDFTLTWWHGSPPRSLSLDLRVDRVRVQDQRLTLRLLRVRHWSSEVAGSFDSARRGLDPERFSQGLRWEFDMERGGLAGSEGHAQLRSKLAAYLKSDGVEDPSPLLAGLQQETCRAAWEALLRAPLEPVGSARVEEGRLTWASANLEAPGFEGRVTLRATRYHQVRRRDVDLTDVAEGLSVPWPTLAAINGITYPRRKGFPPLGYPLELPEASMGEPTPVQIGPALVTRFPFGPSLGSITESRLGYAFEEREGWRRIQWAGAWAWVPSVFVSRLERTPKTLVVGADVLHARSEPSAHYLTRRDGSFVLDETGQRKLSKANIYSAAVQGQRLPWLAWNSKRETWAQVWMGEKKAWLCRSDLPKGKGTVYMTLTGEE